jgi:hypothetical protein
MSRARLRYLSDQLCTIKELSELLGTNPTRCWLFRKGCDSLSAEEVAVVEAHVMGKLQHLNEMVSPSEVCAA